MKTEQGTVNEKNTKVEGERQKNRVQYRDPRAASREECALQAGSGAECEEAPSCACGWVEDVVERVLLRPKRDVAGRVRRRPKRDVAGRVLLGPKRDVAGRLLLRPKRDVAGASAAWGRKEWGRASCWGRSRAKRAEPGELLAERSRGRARCCRGRCREELEADREGRRGRGLVERGRRSRRRGGTTITIQSRGHQCGNMRDQRRSLKYDLLVEKNRVATRRKAGRRWRERKESSWLFWCLCQSDVEERACVNKNALSMKVVLCTMKIK